MQAQALAQDLRELLAARADDLRAFAQIAAAAAESRQLPDLSSVPTRVLLTGGGALAAVALALVPRGRRAVGEVVDTVLATALLIVLIAVLLSLPLGAHVSPQPRH